MIASISKTKEILNNYDLQAKKRFGQNFLVDSNIVNKIVETANVNKNTTVIEIGPGIGAMTEVLLKNAKKVICFEIDNDMINILNNELKDYPNLEIYNIDFLKVNLKDYQSIKKECDDDRILVVSNLPYYITTPIIMKLLNEKIVDEIYVMIQLEVANRLVGSPGTKDYGSLSVLIKYFSEAKYEFKVGRNCFYPSPNVDSGIVSMKKIKRDYNVNNEPNFLKFVQDIFEMRRKTLVNNIISKKILERSKIEEILINNGLNIAIRSESLSLDQIVKIYKLIYNN